MGQTIRVRAPSLPPPRRRLLSCVLLIISLGPSCRTSAADPRDTGGASSVSVATTAPAGDPARQTVAPEVISSGTCREAWEARQKHPELPGNPSFEARRTMLLLRAKAEPVLFFETPAWAPYSNPAVKSHRDYLAQTTHHWDALAFALDKFRGRPDIGREVLLRDGYLYAEHPHMAYAMDQQVRPEHLFDAERIWVQRGQHVFFARRIPDGTYVYESSHPDHPEPVSLLHLDRLGAGTPPPPLHADLRTLRDRLGFDRLRVVHLSKEQLLADLEYDGQTVHTVLRAEGARLELVCEWFAEGERQAIDQAQQRARVRRGAVRRLQHAMHEQVVDALPFDEPKNEVGNQDGSLRNRWWRAYESGRNGFDENGETYSVWNRFGRARPPQVCVDFITDTFERAAGTWYTPRSEARERRVGTLDFAQFETLALRRVPNLIQFAIDRPDWFDVVTTDFDERIRLGLRERFFADLERAPDRHLDGDVLIVRGPTPEDPKHLHYHSFFIYETDPLSGVPVAIVGNSGHPHVWSLEDESRRAPDRSIWHRIRLRQPLLELIARAPSAHGEVPTPLVEESPSP